MFVGRDAEGRALLLSVRSRRSVVLCAPPGYGKSALLEAVSPGFMDRGAVLRISKVGPFSTFLDDLFLELRREGIALSGLRYGPDLKADLKAWKKHTGETVALRARSLLEGLKTYASVGDQRVCIVIDDASELSSSVVPWFLAFDAVCVLVFATFPQTLAKKPLHRLWARFDRIDLPQLPPREARTLLEALMLRYAVVAENPEAYGKRVLSLSSGIPAEIDRLVRFVAVEAVVRNRDVGTGFAQDVAQRQERGVALSPVLLILGGVAMVVKYLGIARGEMDLYLLGGIGIAVMLVFGPMLRRLVMAQG